MTRYLSLPLGVFLVFFLLFGCGGGSNSGGAGGSGTPQDIPTLNSIAPSSVVAGAPGLTLSLYGANFQVAQTFSGTGRR
jgi:hypothetical protein